MGLQRLDWTLRDRSHRLRNVNDDTTHKERLSYLCSPPFHLATGVKEGFTPELETDVPMKMLVNLMSRCSCELVNLCAPEFTSKITDNAETRHVNKGVDDLLEQPPRVFLREALGDTLDICEPTMHARYRGDSYLLQSLAFNIFLQRSLSGFASEDKVKTRPSECITSSKRSAQDLQANARSGQS